MSEQGTNIKTPETRPMSIQKDADSKYQCDICDVCFKSDLDAIRHLNAPLHLRNKNNFLSTQGQNKSLAKHIPKNLEDIFKSLEVYSPKDLRELAGKGYFDIVDQKTADIAEEMVDVLYLNYINFMSKKKLPAELATRIASRAEDLIGGRYKP